MRKLFKTLIILVVLVAVAGALYALARSNKGDKDGLKQVTIESGSITEKAIAVGQIQPRQKFSIKSKLSGIVKTCLVNVGDRVRTGDAMFEIAPDPTPQELTDVDRQLDSARASYERAQADFSRAQELVRQGLLPKSDMDARREAFELAKIALARAEQGRELTRRGRIAGAGISMESIVRAPAAGTVLTRTVNPGDPITPLTSYQPGTELATVADMTDLIFKGTVDEIDVGKLRVGLPTRIKVGALPTDVVTGSVSRIAPQAQQKEGATLFDVEIELAKNTAIVLRAGYSANADVIIREKKEVLIVPERVVTFEDGGKKAFVEIPSANPKEEPKKTEVKLGISDGMNAEVLSGLAKGAKVVERPPKKIS
jgi:HlyD family secretion protein